MVRIFVKCSIAWLENLLYVAQHG